MTTTLAKDRWICAMFAAVDGGDMVSFRECFAPDAKIWHSSDEKFMSADETASLLQDFQKLAQEISYEDQQIFEAGDGVYFVQHLLRAKLNSGRIMQLPVVMRIDVNTDGFVTALYEYYDSRGADCLAAEEAGVAA